MEREAIWLSYRVVYNKFKTILVFNKRKEALIKYEEIIFYILNLARKGFLPYKTENLSIYGVLYRGKTLASSAAANIQVLRVYFMARDILILLHIRLYKSI